jgi:S-DNA-T family DNA segregation ATPase FtsK/SpoIIIE
LIAAARWIAQGCTWLVRSIWSGARGVVQAQRELSERKNAKRPAAEDEEEEAEDEDEGEEAEEEAEDEGEEAEDEEAEDEEAEEVEEAVKPARRARKAKAKPVEAAEPARKPRQNRKRKQGEGEAEGEAEAETSEVAAPVVAAASAGKASAAKASPAPAPEPAPEAEPSDESESDERPEIVLNEDPDEDSADAGESDESGETPEAAANTGGSASDDKRKKAPLTPAELAARARAKQAEAAAAASAAAAPKAAARREGAQRVTYVSGTYELPPAHLFAAVEKAKVKIDKDFIYEQAERIVEAFAQFKIKGKVTKIHPGPVITRYEFKPEAGVKVSRIQNLENDLAMALEALRIRILAPIPGKSTVGLEVPNAERETVYLQENLTDPSFWEGDAKLPLVLGKDIVGKCVSVDLAKAPHLLVAGATGSGKSVGVNGMLCSLLHACTPEQLRMILIDPKMLEFSVYKDIPHLLLPVITDAEKANLALRWAVNEMERRYALLSEAGVRDINGFNKKLPQLQAEWDGESKALEAEAADLAAEARLDGEDSVNGAMLSGVEFDAQGNAVAITGGVALPPRPESLPFIVIVIDEFADLMMVASKEVEANVARLAAKARAAGVHLIVATQRPSVDVITGTIKNNFPSRIAFQVTSDIDSRTILDQKGAKQLLGMGDMLYMDRGKEPRRVHGCFVSETEIERVVDFVRKQAKPAYNMDITRKDDDEVGAGAAEVEDKVFDPLYDKAVQIVAETGKVSTSMIQRRLNVGYNRAAKMVERMEEEGAIGPPNGTRPREVFVSAA